jgi:hypothetical protein
MNEPTEFVYGKKYHCACGCGAGGYFSFMSENDLPVFADKRVGVIINYTEGVSTEGWQEDDNDA